MLGTLQIDINFCINEYLNMVPDIFPVKSMVSGNKVSKLMKVVRGKQLFDSNPLKEVVKGLVQKHLANKATRGEDTLLRFKAS